MPPIFLDADQTTLAATSRLIWGVIAAMLAVVCVLYWAVGLSIDVWSGRFLLPVAPACAIMARFYRVHRPDPWISFGAESTAQVLCILVLATLLTYPVAAADFPYRDAELYALDRMLGFDWRSYLAFVNAHPTLGLIGNIAYFSMKPQTALVIGALVIAARFGRLQQFTLALAVSLVVTIAIFMLVPAVAYYAHLGVTPVEFSNLQPSVPYEHVRHLEGMRLGLTTIIHFNDLEGMITFPSFHATSAILFTWAMWPFRRARWWMLGLNALLIAATPIDGGHYAIDLAGGAVVAAFSIYAAVRIAGVLAGRGRARTETTPLEPYRPAVPAE
jgi:membrane-associated phospholipid phosphatase